ncbi:ABC 3 transport family protein [Lactobacillus johnsonii]|nr:metal ABC transporter permease [Lactobacillus johnsonii]TWU79407.1 ABC 3 transport family protein [Lactobacillus johnsonii]
MRYAFLASTFIAITCGIVGVYVVARSFSFLAHTLSEIGFAGAAFAVWIGWVPLWGMVLFTLLGSISVGELSMRSDQKESAISAIFSLVYRLGCTIFSYCWRVIVAMRLTSYLVQLLELIEMESFN